MIVLGMRLLTVLRCHGRKHVYAGARDGHLVTITSQEENNVIPLASDAGYPEDGPYWIGLHEVGGDSSPGQFQWVTGEVLDYTYWWPSHPEYNGGTSSLHSYL